MADGCSEPLIRDIGVRQLTASIVNSTIGAGIFVVPALVAQGLGAAAPLAYVICAVTMAMLVTTFAMAGSRVTRTGELFAYVEVAFGPYVGFLAGTLQWVSCLFAAGGVAIAVLDASGVALPALQAPAIRLAMLAILLGLLAWINSRGVRTGARTIECLTAAKLIPLLCFVVVGAFAVHPSALAWPGTPGAGSVGRAVLLLSFAFVGIELALTPSGEVRQPARTVPRAIWRWRSRRASMSPSRSWRRASSARSCHCRPARPLRRPAVASWVGPERLSCWPARSSRCSAI